MNSFKVLIDAKSNGGKPVIVAFKPMSPLQQAGNELVNFQASIIPVEWSAVNTWNKTGLLRYYNEKSKATGSSVVGINPREAGADAHTRGGFNASLGVKASQVKVVTSSDLIL